LLVQAQCPRCGAALPADAAECPICAYGDVADIVLLEAQAPGAPRPAPAEPPPPNTTALPRVLAAVAILVVVVVAIFAALR
jgi:hypothetical protein